MRSVAILLCVGLIVLCAATPLALAGGHWGGCGGPHFGFGLTIAPGGYYYPGYAYPYPAYPCPYAYPAYPYPYYAGAAPVAPPVAAATPAPTNYSQGPTTYSQNMPLTPNASTTPAQSRVTYASNGTFDVRLPDAQGEVWVDGKKIGGSGANRTFRSRSAQEGSHIYKVTAAWNEGGQIVTEERMVGVSNGQKTTVDFTKPDQTALKAPPPPEPYQKQR